MTPERFTIHIPKNWIDDMIARIRATAWPVGGGDSDWSMGV